MEIFDIIKNRHSVRKYKDIKIPSNILDELRNEINQCNLESGLNIQLVINDNNAFSGVKAHYGVFKGVKNYIVLVGKRSSKLDELIGYYGQRIVLKVQELGLNSCWIGLNLLYKKTKGAYKVNWGESKRLIIAIGYGETQGHERNSKSFREVVSTECEDYPKWFKRGVEFALLAPTATNQQKFTFEIENNVVELKRGIGFYSKVDQGIVKYHFELGAGKENFIWKN